VGQKGDSGAKGDKGDPGTPGTPGLSEVELVSAASVNNTATGLKTVTVSCPAGKKVIGGGAEIQSSPAFPITVDRPAADLSGWTASGIKDTASGAFWGVADYAICAKVA
jgi:hypothetical protein